MGSIAVDTCKAWVSRSLSLTVLLLGAALLVTWWTPSSTRVQFSVADAPQVEGYRRSVELALPERGWLWSKFWRQPDHKLDRCLVYMSCGTQVWQGRASTIPAVAANRGAIRLGAGGLLNFSLPDEAACETLEVSWVNLPRAWLGPTCALFLLSGLLLVLPRCGAYQEWAIAAAACALATGLSARLITDTPVANDASQNLAMMLNLVNHGTYSMETREPLNPTNYREPLPNFAAATAILAGRWIERDAMAPEIRQTRDLIAAKSANLVWVFVGLLATWSLAWAVSRQHSLGLISAYLAWIVFYSDSPNVNSLLSETHAAALLAGASAALVISFDRLSWFWAISTGVLLGLLFLTKASFLYIGVALLVGVAVFAVFGIALRVQQADCVRILRLTAASACAAALVCIPWMARNNYHFGTWSITQRSGVVLMVRATKNQMTHAEWIASWWIWGPSLYRLAVSGTAWGAEQQDFKPGGPYERLSRSVDNKAVSFYHTGRAEKSKVFRQAKLDGQSVSEVAVDAELGKRAREMIQANWTAHLKCTLPFVWRGVWCASVSTPFAPPFPAPWERHVSAIWSACLWLSLWISLAFALWRRSAKLGAATVLSAAMLAIHAIATHNIPRYSTPAIPVMCVTFTVLVCWSTRPVVHLVKRKDRPVGGPRMRFGQ